MSKTDSKNETWIFLPKQFSKNCKIEFKIQEWNIYLKNFEKNIFSLKSVYISLLNFEFNFAIFRKLRGQKKIKISDFLGIKSKISQSGAFELSTCDIKSGVTIVTIIDTKMSRLMLW